MKKKRKPQRYQKSKRWMMNRWLEKNQQLTLNRRTMGYTMEMPWKRRQPGRRSRDLLRMIGPGGEERRRSQ
jgi:hypothetical protein